VWAKCGPEIA
jgi:integrase